MGIMASACDGTVLTPVVQLTEQLVKIGERIESNKIVLSREKEIGGFRGLT